MARLDTKGGLDCIGSFKDEGRCDPQRAQRLALEGLGLTNPTK